MDEALAWLRTRLRGIQSSEHDGGGRPSEDAAATDSARRDPGERERGREWEGGREEEGVPAAGRRE